MTEKQVLAVNGLYRLVIYPEEDFADDDTPILVGWAYQISIYFDGGKHLFKGGFKSEEEAITAGKERLKLSCQGFIDDLRDKIALYEQVLQSINPP